MGRIGVVDALSITKMSNVQFVFLRIDRRHASNERGLLYATVITATSFISKRLTLFIEKLIDRSSDEINFTFSEPWIDSEKERIVKNSVRIF